MNIYDVIVESLLEGGNPFTKQVKKSREDLEGAKTIKRKSDRIQKGSGEKMWKSNTRSLGRASLQWNTKNSPHVFGDSAGKYRREGNKINARRELEHSKKYSEYHKPKLPESLAYEIYDIICEGLVKAANKAKKNAHIKKLGGREQNRVDQIGKGPMSGVTAAGEYRRGAVKAGHPELVKDGFHKDILKGK